MSHFASAVETIYTKPAWVFVKITTDNGIIGWGEASYGGRDRAAGAAVEEAARYLVGTDPTELERHWQHLYRGAATTADRSRLRAADTPAAKL